MIAQSVAENTVRAEGGILVGPLKAVTVFKVQFMTNARTAGTPFPFAEKLLLQYFKSSIVSTAIKCFILRQSPTRRT